MVPSHKSESSPFPSHLFLPKFLVLFFKNGSLEEHLLENCWSVVLAVSQCLHAGRENRSEGTKTWETNSMNLSILGKSAGHRIF